MSSERIAEYDVVVDFDTDNFVSAVRSLIEKGWEPHGGVAVVYDDKAVTEFRFRYYQAMIRRESVEFL